jgi:hypothetical protein
VPYSRVTGAERDDRRMWPANSEVQIRL